MDLRDYLRLLRRRWISILLITLLGAAAAFALTLIQTKQYASSVRLFVSTSQLNESQILQGGQFSQARVQSYADLATSRGLAEDVIDSLGLDMTPTELAEKVEAEVAVNTVNLTLRVVDAHPRNAQRIAQGYADSMVELVRVLETPPGATEAPIKATIVDNASYSDRAISPNPVRSVALGATLGLLLGFGLALLRQVIDTRVTSQDDISEVADAPLLGAIPYDGAADKKPLLSDIQSHAPRSEAFRVLRTNLQFVDVDSHNKVVVVTSALLGEGKTTTSTNLAISLAQAGVRTLLVEADLRRPRARVRLGMDGAIGLTNVLVGRVQLDEALQVHTDTSLAFLASGSVPPNPAELLQSKAMADVLVEIRSRYDIVVIDAPPLLPVTDAALLAAKADGALLIARHGKVTREQIRHSLERLRQVDARLMGVVLNMVPSRGKGYGYGYGYAPDADSQELK